MWFGFAGSGGSPSFGKTQAAQGYDHRIFDKSHILRMGVGQRGAYSCYRAELGFELDSLSQRGPGLGEIALEREFSCKVCIGVIKPRIFGK
jgi:hypothetical protein